jgi:ribosomal protein S18 acetylase RimI-like enzyme
LKDTFVNLTPFPVDPETLQRIRPMQFRDAARVAELHRQAMGNSLWASLGGSFLRELYKAMVDSPYFLGFVYVEDGEVKGFIAGTIDTKALFNDIFKRRMIFIAPAALLGLVRHPLVLGQLVETARYMGKSGAPDVSSESLFCSFVPELRGKRVSGHINKVLFDELLARGYSKVKISTEADNAGALRQLQSWGFKEAHRFRFYGKEMVTFVLELLNHPRLEAVSRHPAV